MGKIKKTVIITGYSCNNKCIFCIHSNRRPGNDKSTDQIVREMVEARKRQRSYLEIIGGEQTIRNDIVTLIRTAKKLGFRDIVMSTNGRLLLYEQFCNDLISSGITGIIFSIHGHTAKLHDSLTQVGGSFDQLLKGIMNVKSSGFKKIGSNTTIVKQNYKQLRQIGSFIYDIGIRNSEFIFVDPSYGGAFSNFSKIVPRISQIAPYARQCLDVGRTHGVSHWHIRYVPLCYFAGYEDRISEIHEKRMFHTEHLGPDFKNFNVEKSREGNARIKTKQCKGCSYYDECEGIWKEYVRHYGSKELMPVSIKPSRIKPAYAYDSDY